MSLKQKTVYGILWTFADAFLVKGLSFVSMLLLARWLGPNDFGLIGMLALFIGIGTSLVESGLPASLIRTKKTDNIDFSTVFYMNMAMSLVVYTLLFFIAPYIADFYGQQILVNIIRVYCISFIISAFSTVQLTILQKEMKFKKITLLNVPSTILGVLVGLCLGYNDYGVWSIVAMYLTTQVILSFLLWSTTNWRPSFTFSIEKLQYHYKFGYKLMLSGLLNIVFNNSYHVLIGKYFPLQTLGYYERAQRFNEYPSITITGIVEKVTYPMMAKLQDDKQKLSVIYRKMLRLAFFITAPLMLGVAAMAQPIFEIVLGEEWLPAVPYFQILSIAYMFYPIHAFNINVLKVFGRSDLFLKLEIIKKIIIVVGIVVGFQFGILGLVWSGVLTSFLALLVNTYYSSQLIDYSTKKQLLDMVPILVLAVSACLLMYCVVDGFNNYQNGVQILSATFLGTLFYLSIHSLIKKSPMYDLLAIIKDRNI
ncbi:O-antigen/teichoic acid export membrane protein [Saonia flava]|uniref:O-antigen/teichoic acid export membrane protein n=1 Tax=Saonia flava TaxID=523696 RepID=A0A846QZM2_9FLAO|nr:lipopolysaccharide biosynthesis protein [Saonia flava]NJB72647.1 O-antigen/teichoic acid export membrane protein [Saonia flava]